jgi:hypothetical protein
VAEELVRLGPDEDRARLEPVVLERADALVDEGEDAAGGGGGFGDGHGIFGGAE